MVIGYSPTGFPPPYNRRVKLHSNYSLTIIFDSGLLTLKTLPYWAVCRLPCGKLARILTYFQAKIKKNLIVARGFHLRPDSDKSEHRDYGGQAWLGGGKNWVPDKRFLGQAGRTPRQAQKSCLTISGLGLK
jgi:hypothetical protein